MVSKAFEKGIKEDVLAGKGFLVFAVEFSASLGLSDTSPVGGSVRGARESVLFDKGFQEKRAVGVALLPVVRQPFDDAGEDPRGEVS